jgi:hypothetical protein
MEGTMERMCGWVGDEDAPIPNDDKDGPLAKDADSKYAKVNNNNKYASGKDDGK